MNRKPTSWGDVLNTVARVKHPELEDVHKLWLIGIALSAGETGEHAYPGYFTLSEITDRKFDRQRIYSDRCIKLGLVELVKKGNGPGSANEYRICLENPAYPEDYKARRKDDPASVGKLDSGKLDRPESHLSRQAGPENDPTSEAGLSHLLGDGDPLLEIEIPLADSGIPLATRAFSGHHPILHPKLQPETTTTTATTTKIAFEWLWWLWSQGRERCGDYKDQYDQHIGSTLNTEAEDIAEIESLCQRYDWRIVMLAWALYAFLESPPYDSRTRRPAMKFWKNFERDYLEPATVQRERCRQFGWKNEADQNRYVEACREFEHRGANEDS